MCNICFSYVALSLQFKLYYIRTWHAELLDPKAALQQPCILHEEQQSTIEHYRPACFLDHVI